MVPSLSRGIPFVYIRLAVGLLMASGQGDPYFPGSVASNGPELVEGHSVCLHSTRRLAVGLLMASGRGDPYFPASVASNGPELVEGHSVCLHSTSRRLAHGLRP